MPEHNMSEEFYGLVDENNVLIEYFKIDEDNLQLIEVLKQQFNATAAYKMNLEKENTAIGSTYWNGQRFVHPPMYSSWIFNNDINDWEPPVSYPNDGNLYLWNENSLSWDLYSEPN